jgi:acetyl esterase/lipase
MTGDEVTSPQISLFFANLTGKRLPAAFFTCGTEDCLLDDSVFMSVKWMMAGSEAIIRIYPGNPHGYILFSLNEHEYVSAALQDLQTLIIARMTNGAKSIL